MRKKNLSFDKGLVKKIYQLPFDCNELHLTVFVTYMISYEMVSDLNMFCPRVLNLMVCEIDGTCVVTQ